MVKEDYIPDCIFPSDNQADIPNLLLDMAPEFCQVPFYCFGEQKRTFDMKGAGTLHFYTDDYKFNALFERPETIIKQNPACMVEPNYSLYFDTPLAFGLQYIYKKRFIARAMQERGIKVIVDMNVSHKFLNLNLLGVPKGYPAYCTRGYSDRLGYLEREYEMAKAHADGNRMLFIVYGGGDKCRKFAGEHDCVYVTPLCRFVDKLKRNRELDKEIQFTGENLDEIEFKRF